jgi:hypothetical protein
MFFVVKKKNCWGKNKKILLGKKRRSMRAIMQETNIVGEKTKKYESYYARKKYC